MANFGSSLAQHLSSTLDVDVDSISAALESFSFDSPGNNAPVKQIAKKKVPPKKPAAKKVEEPAKSTKSGKTQSTSSKKTEPEKPAKKAVKGSSDKAPPAKKAPQKAAVVEKTKPSKASETKGTTKKRAVIEGDDDDENVQKNAKSKDTDKHFCERVKKGQSEPCGKPAKRNIKEGDGKVHWYCGADKSGCFSMVQKAVALKEVNNSTTTAKANTSKTTKAASKAPIPKTNKERKEVSDQNSKSLLKGLSPLSNMKMVKGKTTDGKQIHYHPETRIIFDREDNCACGIFTEDNTIERLTDEHVRILEGSKYKIKPGAVKSSRNSSASESAAESSEAEGESEAEPSDEKESESSAETSESKAESSAEKESESAEESEEKGSESAGSNEGSEEGSEEAKVESDNSDDD